MKWEEYWPNWAYKFYGISKYKSKIIEMLSAKENNDDAISQEVLSFLEETVGPIWAWSEFGRNIFDINPQFINLLCYTDIADVPIEFIKLPYPHLYINGSYDNGLFEGALIHQVKIQESGKHGFLIKFVNKSETATWFFDKDETTIGGAINKERERCEVSESEFAVHKKYLSLIINVLLYINSPAKYIDEKYPNLPVHLQYALDKADTKRRKEKAEQAIKEAGYTKIKYVGQSFANMDTGEGAGKATHWRRGHWHTVLTGPGKQVRELRWFMPTIINHDKGEPTKGHVYEV